MMMMMMIMMIIIIIIIIIMLFGQPDSSQGHQHLSGGKTLQN
jgi:uncharacterized membrane protein